MHIFFAVHTTFEMTSVEQMGFSFSLLFGVEDKWGCRVKQSKYGPNFSWREKGLLKTSFADTTPLYLTLQMLIGCLL